ncbi:MAG TPA: type I glutamate--ammonia ligase [Gammaproteobacteria bacterium]|nr:type I glutamate--ammonia ligase [Gammaproteobacteria bacterium]
MTIDEILRHVAAGEFAFVDLRFTDTRGKEQHVTVNGPVVDAAFFDEGKPFDGSSIAGWKHINDSDMVLMPDPASAVRDPFAAHPTLILRCDVLEPATLEGYGRDPRSIAKRAEAYILSSGLAEGAWFGPENEFFIFDDVRWGTSIDGAFYKVDSKEANWNSGRVYADGNFGHRPSLKGGYFPVPPVDSLQDVRSEMCRVLGEMGIAAEVHHHEVATAGQCEIGVNKNTLVRKADEVQMLKYVVMNVAQRYGKTATFMPKPLVGDNGNGMHVHVSLFRKGENLFAGDGYGGLSDTALYFIGGVIRHARALNAFTNPATNSYKRLVPGFEAPVKLAYSVRNRSASIRVPYAPSGKARRIEVRFPDGLANPYFAFSALALAGLDGLANRVHPGEAMDKDLYDLPPEISKNVPEVAYSLEEALKALDCDREFLTAAGVFTDDTLDAYIALKGQDIQRLRMTTHPVEFDLYYSL